MEINKYLMTFYVEKNGEQVTPELAEIIVHDMAVTDGSDRETGEKWSMQESREIGDKLGVNWTEILQAEWYLVLNMMYSDYYSVGKKHGLTDFPFYAELAVAWFKDEDGKPDKTFRYFVC